MSAKMIKCKACSNDVASNAKNCPNCGAKIKKPIYKKWWFWLIVVIAVISIASASGSEEANTNDKPVETQQSDEINANTEETTKSDIWTKSGTYKVGTEIPAGEYIVVATSGNCYVEVNKDSTGSFESIVSNDNTSTCLYVTLIEGQYFKVSGGKFALEDKVAPFEAENGVYEQGVYKVGKDIPAGEYKITANDSNCYIEVSSDSYMTFNSIITNDNISLGESTYITVSEGQYLKFNGGQIVTQ